MSRIISLGVLIKHGKNVDAWPVAEPELFNTESINKVEVAPSGPELDNATINSKVFYREHLGFTRAYYVSQTRAQILAAASGGS